MNRRAESGGRALAAALVLVVALLPATAALAEVTHDVKVAGNPGAEGFPGDLFVRVVSPPEYGDGCCQEPASGEWSGPAFETKSGSAVGLALIKWAVVFDTAATSTEDAARRNQSSGWPEVESAAIQVKRREGDQVAEQHAGHFVVSKNSAANAAEYQASVAVGLKEGLWAVATYTVVAPATTDHEVKGTVPAAQWNNEQIHAAVNAFALVGPLPKFGTSGDDEINGTGKNDVIVLGAGNDKSNGENGNDSLNGQAGNDVVQGGLGHDRVVGASGNDQVFGDNALGLGKAARPYSAAQATELNDVVLGGTGDDLLSGGGGDDTLNGGPGYDVIKGGPGTDTCIVDQKKELKKVAECEKVEKKF